MFPLSNPATQAECTFAEAMESTEDRVIFASGTAFPSYTTAQGQVRFPGQGNNMFIFPGLGLGASLAKPRSISDGMIYASSKALADSLTSEELDQGWLYPSLVRIRQVSAIVAASVIVQARKEGLARNKDLEELSFEELVEYATSHMWCPTQDHYGDSHI